MAALLAVMLLVFFGPNIHLFVLLALTLVLGGLMAWSVMPSSLTNFFFVAVCAAAGGWTLSFWSRA